MPPTPNQPTASPPPPKSSKTPLIIGGVVGAGFLAFCGLCFCVSVGVALVSPTPKPVAVAATPTPILPTDTPAPLPTATKYIVLAPSALPTDTPAPLDPLADLQQRIVEAIGSYRRIEPPAKVSSRAGQILVEWAIGDSFTPGLMVKGAKSDINKILRIIVDGAVPYDDVRLQGSFSMADKFGNASEMVVVDVVYRAETIDKINWQNLDIDNLYDIADSKKIHAEFQ